MLRAVNRAAERLHDSSPVFQGRVRRALTTRCRRAGPENESKEAPAGATEIIPAEEFLSPFQGYDNFCYPAPGGALRACPGLLSERRSPVYVRFFPATVATVEFKPRSAAAPGGLTNDDAPV